MTDEPATAEDLQDILAAAVGLRGRYMRLTSSGPTETSMAAAAARLPLGRKTWSLASMFWVAGGDNLIAWHHLLAGAKMQPLVAHGTLARATLECAVMVRWLVQPGLSPTDYRNRGAQAQLADYRLEMGFERSARLPEGYAVNDTKMARSRERELLDEMRRDHVRIRGDPDPTTLFRTFGVPGNADATWLYRLVSGYAHGRPWAMGTNRLDVIEGPSLPAGMPFVSATAQPEVAVLVATAATRALTTALEELEAFGGR